MAEKGRVIVLNSLNACESGQLLSVIEIVVD